jgi:hypothetical protein
MAERRATFAVGDHRQRGDRVASIGVVPALILDLRSQPRIDDSVIANDLPADAGTHRPPNDVHAYRASKVLWFP